MTISFNPAYISLVLTIIGAVIGFVVQCNLIKYRLKELEKKQSNNEKQIEKSFENDNESAPTIQETARQVESIIVRLDRLEEATKNIEISVSRIDERINIMQVRR
jgi:uncharacterized membrane protein YgaE (UPF0421/DUF939 family)